MPVESTPSLTGAKADHRLPMRASGVEAFGRQVAAALGAAGGAAGTDNGAWVAAVAKDLQAHRGTSLVVAGDYQPAAVHALAHAMNQALDNVGATVTYGPAIEAAPQDQASSMTRLERGDGRRTGRDARHPGRKPGVHYTGRSEVRRPARQNPLVIYHGLYVDETAYLSHWTVPESHPLESWGDARAYDGTVTMIEPLISPLYEGRSAHEVLALVAGQPGRGQLAMVKDFWTRAFNGQGWTFRGPDGKPFPSADAFWKRALHDGFIRGTSLADGGPATPFVAAPKPAGAAAAAAVAAAAARSRGRDDTGRGAHGT